ncbi:erythromycin esterase family protein [Variovorax guangxiensis]|uniref:erythromycin esterase family protein n=1 Tax=Variovorax guangxiensis TaxID=1775474 RepID=UPI002864FB7A|nr:erythromycin esterase family protein [Variovorax guangxiensis]MDR6855473.1 erythromycin esterase-like protein [Variovorax guangxiensis]
MRGARPDDDHAVRAIRAAACPLDVSPHCHAALLFAIADARFVLLGEASHGTDDFYRERAAITKRLIEDKAFDAVAVEADWPDALRVDRFVRGASDDSSALQALGDFRRFPAWMWRNQPVREFVDWLRASNQKRPTAERVGFYGIDLYSLYTSIASVLDYLDRVDPEAARRARYRYGCFDHFGEDTQAYGHAAAFDLGASCEEAAVAQLRELLEKRADHAGADAHFHAEQNARLVRNAEHYYRTMFKGRVASWNLRDRHMAQTLEALDAHLGAQRSRPARIAVWAHNSHLGDARATEMAEIGELNVGQLMRERYGAQCFNVGFTTADGEVMAASAWDGEAERKRVNPPLAGSIEALLHESGLGRFALILRNNEVLAEALADARLQRAIGVIYAPATERQSHYFHARVGQQFDALVHLDHSSALEPLD